jgi:hypothetical protein
MKPSQAAYAALRKYEHIRLEYYDNDGAGNCSFGEGFLSIMGHAHQRRSKEK